MSDLSRRGTSLAFTFFASGSGATTFADTMAPGERRINSGSPPRLTSVHPSQAANPEVLTPIQFLPSFDRPRLNRPSGLRTSRDTVLDWGGSLPGPPAMVKAATGRPSGPTTLPVTAIVGSIVTTSLSALEISRPISSRLSFLSMYPSLWKVSPSTRSGLCKNNLPSAAGLGVPVVQGGRCDSLQWSFFHVEDAASIVRPGFRKMS